MAVNGEARFTRLPPSARPVAAALLLLALPASAIQQIGLSVGTITHPFFSIQDLSLELDLGPPGSVPSGRLRAAGIGFGEQRIGPMTVDCGSIEVDAGEVRCAPASVELDLPGEAALVLRGEIRRRQADDTLAVQLSGSLAGEPAEIRLDYASTGGRLEVSLPEIPLESLAGTGFLEGWWLEGRAALSATVELDGAANASGTVVLSLAEATVASPDGSIASEELDATLTLGLRGDGDGQRGIIRLRARKGLAYADPVLLDAGAYPTDVVAGVTHRDGQSWLEQLRIRQPGLLQARGQARVDWSESPPLQRLSLQLDDLALPAGFDTYLQPFLIGTVFDSLSLAGGVTGELVIRDGRPASARLGLDAVRAEDRRERFDIDELSGTLRWSLDGTAPPSRVGWQGASIYRLGIGAADLDMELAGNTLRLRRPLGIPVEDGRLLLEHLEATGLGADDFQATLEGRLEPVSLQALSRALEWPELPGTVAGQIPRITYRDRRLSLDGALQAQVFDGRLTIPRLRISEPMGRFPQLESDIVLRDLDLEQITGTFAFGRITGRLDGDITGLELLDWEPVAFDAHFYTSPGTPAARRISQRAIENIADLGGGGGALVSGTFLRLFDQFRYRQLGIRCRLREEVCRMSGVMPAEAGGYYLVEGAGVPRVDVIGFTQEVDWPTLLEQLRVVTE